MNGKTIYYTPEQGNACCGNNGDSYLWDQVLLENVDGISDLLPMNDIMGVPDGAVVILDKGFGFSQALKNNLHTYVHPNLSRKIRPESQEGANTGRLATMWRWSNEKCFIIFSTLFKLWRQTIPTVYVPHLGTLANICGSIVNFTGWGCNHISLRRMKELYLMKIKLNQDNILNPQYYGLLHDFKNASSLTERRGKNVYHWWKKAATVDELCTGSQYWNRERLSKLLITDVDQDLRVVGGGTFSARMAKSYCYHSRDFIGIYYSNHKPYQQFIMVRNLKKKMSKFKIDKPNTRDQTTNHHVLLMIRKGKDIIFNTSEVFNYPPVCTLTRSVCYGRHGNRTISTCGHRTAATIIFIYGGTDYRSRIHIPQLPTGFQTY